MRPRQMALLALLAIANLGLLSLAVLAASPNLAPLPSLLLVAPLPTLAPVTGPERKLATPPVVHYQNPSPNNVPAPTATAVPAVSDAQPTSPSVEPTTASLEFPEEAFVVGVRGRRQSLPLSCESRSAVDWAAFFGVAIDELDFLGGLPLSDDPDRGFVGDVRGAWGQTPPNAYGVHAGPVARLLSEYGLPAGARRYMKWEALQAEIAAGRPVIAWVVGHVDDGEAQVYTATDGRQTIVASFEHTVIVVGYTSNTVTVVDGANVREHTLDEFLRSWDVLRNMAVVLE